MSCPELIVQSLWEMPSPHRFFSNWAAVTNRVIITNSSSSQGFWTQRAVANSSSSLFGLGNGNAIAADCSFYIACESCRAYKWVMSHVWMSHVPHKYKPRHTQRECHRRWLFVLHCLWVMSHMKMSHVTCMNESCHMYEWIMSRKKISHVTHTGNAVVVDLYISIHSYIHIYV